MSSVVERVTSVSLTVVEVDRLFYVTIRWWPKEAIKLVA